MPPPLAPAHDWEREFWMLVELHRSSLLLVARRFAGGHIDGDDLLSTAIMKVWRKCSRGLPAQWPHCFYNYMRKALYSCSGDALRKDYYRLRNHIEEDTFEEIIGNESVEYERSTEDLYIEQLFESLPADDRELLQLLASGLSIRQIANRQQLARGTIYTRVRSLRMRLKEYIADRLEVAHAA
jgi:RNA polymerase sigma factor (sigma-70 family)